MSELQRNSSHSPEANRKRIETIRQRYGDEFFKRFGIKGQAASSRKKAVESTRRRHGDDYFKRLGHATGQMLKARHQDERETKELARHITKIKKRLSTLSGEEQLALKTLRSQVIDERLDEIGADSAIGLRKAARLIIAREILASWTDCPSNFLSKVLGIHRRSAQRYLREIPEINRLATQIRVEIVKGNI